MRRSQAASLLAAAPFALTLPAGAQANAHLSVAGPPTEDLTAFYYAITRSRAGASTRPDSTSTWSGRAAAPPR